MKTLLKVLLIISIAALATPALAKPNLTINIKAEVEVVETIDGKEVIKTVPTEEISSGQTIIYTLEVVNSGDQPATNVKMNDPIPKETTYVVGSVFGAEADVSFSIDGGKTYKQPTLLSYRMELPNGTHEERLATPDQYTHIQWLLETVPAGSARTVGFKALVK